MRRIKKNAMSDFKFYNEKSNQKDIMVWDFKSCIPSLEGTRIFSSIGIWMVNWDEKNRHK